MCKKDPGFYAGIMYACALLVEGGGSIETKQAIWIYQQSGMSHGDVKTCAEYDIEKMRRVITDLPKGIK